MGPQHERILIGMAVVPLAGADGQEAEPSVERLGRLVRCADLEGDRGGAPCDRLPQQHQHEPGADAGALPLRIHGDRGHMPVGECEQQSGEPDHGGPHAGHEIDPLGPAGLGEEQPVGPRGGTRVLLDAQHRAQMTSPHGGHHDLRHHGATSDDGPQCVHGAGRVDQLISASGLRR